MADDAALKQWAKQLDKMENTLMEAISSRTRATASVQHTLKLAFKAVDLDEEGYGVETGKVSYEEFSKALERFGLYPTGPEAIVLRGLFDRYKETDDSCPNLSYAVFSRGLYNEVKPWPPPPMRSPEECQTESAEMMRESPANRWANSSGELIPHEKPHRGYSIANEMHRGEGLPKFQGNATETRFEWTKKPSPTKFKETFPG